MNHSIPLTPDAFDPALVQWLIRTKHPDAVVESVTVVDAALSTDGEQKVSTARRIALDVHYVAPTQLPSRLIVKVARPGFGDLPLYDNEVNVYTRLGDELPVRTPRCLGGYRDVEGSSFGLVLEDLRPQGAQFPCVLTPMTAAEVSSLLDQLAALHANYWESTRFNSDLRWVHPHISGPLHDLFTHQSGVPMLINWEVQHTQFKREFVQSVDESPESLLANVTKAQAHQARRPQTLLHGDTHIGNTYALPDGSRGILDWQLAARGFCMHDVTYIIITALSVGDRRSHERDLITHYRQRLVEAGVTDAPTTDDLFTEYRIAAAWCFYIGWLSTPLENYGWEISVANHIRLATAYRDLDTKAAIAALPDLT
ncbi:MAG: phosphotransferase [Candidatus Nanopelagicales bacterium]